MSNKSSFLGDMSPENHSWFAGRTLTSGRAFLDTVKVERAYGRLGWLLGVRERRVEELPRDRAVIVYPGQPGIVTAKQGKPNELYVRALNHMRELVEELGIAPVERGMMTGDGLPGDLTRLLTLSGFPMKPLISPDPFNDYRALKDRFVDRSHENIARAVGKAMFGEWSPEHGLRIARASTAGFPDFTFDVGEKLQMAREGMVNLGMTAQLLERGQLEDLFSRTRTVFAYFSTNRLQQDRATVGPDGLLTPKARPSYGKTFATSAMEEPPVAVKTIEGLTLPAFRQRVRQAFGLPGRLNYPLAAVMSGFRDVYLKKFSKTWVTRGPGDLRDTIQGWHVVGVDVSSFDTNVPIFLLHFYLEAIAKQFPVLRSVLYASLHAPVFTSRQSKDQGPFWTGDPFDISTFYTSSGLPSGVAPNPDLGKAVGTFVGLIVLHELFGDVEGQEEAILNHSHPRFMLKNSADDMLIGCARAEEADIVASALSDPTHPLHEKMYLVLELESPISYLGNAVYQRAPGIYDVEPNINSMLVNWHAPERSAGSNFRPLPAIGWFMREEHFKQSRMYNAVAEIRDKVIKHYFGFTPSDMLRAAYLEESARVGVLTDADLALLEKPERLFYTNIANQGGHVADVLSAVISAEDIRGHLSRYHKQGVEI